MTDASIKDRKVALIGEQTNGGAVAEMAPVGIWHLRQSGETLYANPHLIALLNIERDAFFTERVRALMPAQSHETLDDLFGTKRTFETDLVKNGKVLARVMVVATGWLEVDDDQAAYVSFVDITKLNNLLPVNDEISRLNTALADKIQSLNDAHEQIVRSNKMAQIGQLTATVAHELRNPLGAVRTSVFLLERKLKGKEMGVEAQIERINSGITRCDKIITQLLDFSRTKSLQTKSIDMDDWLEKLVAEEAAKLPSLVNIACDFELRGLIAAFDAEQFSRCVINLLSNASEAMVGKTGELNAAQSGKPLITIKTALTERGIEISVKDNGPGMPPEVLGRIREPLFTTKTFGTGLGLPAVENILQQHQGGMDVSSVVGEGSCFTLWLPLDSNRAASAA